MKTLENIDFEEITLRLEASRRGGGIEIDLTDLGYPGETMTAYQNYLGGGMLGSIANDCTIWRKHKIIEEGMAAELKEIATALAKYFHDITNPDQEEWEHASFESLQQRPVSAY